MKKATWILAGVALAALLVLGAACNTEGKSPEEGASPGAIDTAGLLGILSSPEMRTFASSLVPALSQWGSSQQAGIWVTGWGKVSLEPDLALLSLGVETRAKAVEAARAEAAVALAAMIDALKARGIADRDIQTRYFNISPEYTYEEVYEGGRRYSKQVLTGYQVTNSVTAKVRNMDIVGVTIDEVVQAGGDAARIQSIQFTVEDPSAAQTQAREEATLDALARAQQFATLTGAGLGDLLFITESSGGTLIVKETGARVAYGEAASVAITPISAGELEVEVYVQAIFGIGSP